MKRSPHEPCYCLASPIHSHTPSRPNSPTPTFSHTPSPPNLPTPPHTPSVMSSSFINKISPTPSRLLPEICVDGTRLYLSCNESSHRFSRNFRRAGDLWWASGNTGRVGECTSERESIFRRGGCIFPREGRIFRQTIFISDTRHYAGHIIICLLYFCKEAMSGTSSATYAVMQSTNVPGRRHLWATTHKQRHRTPVDREADRHRRCRGN